MTEEKTITEWVEAAHVSAFSKDGGAAIKVGDDQIAVFNFASRNEWYAVSNLCPHKKQMILSRGMLGDKGSIPKVACPYHKKQFSLSTGDCLDDSSCGSIKTYPVKVENDMVYVGV